MWRRGRACVVPATPRPRPGRCGRPPACTGATSSPTTPTRTGWRPAGATCARPTSRPLGDLADCEAALGDPSAAIALFRQALLIEPEREDVHRRLMTTYVRVGQRAQALRQFGLCSEALRRLLRAEPSPETVALHARIRQGAG